MCGHTTRDHACGSIDIHSGGVDLRFPHHENEIAQSEAYFGCGQWANYWLHTGHLNIAGRKMSKSLKNFTTIRQALTEFSPRSLRMLFLLHPYDAPMDYSDATVERARQEERAFAEFFQNVKLELRTRGLKATAIFGPREFAMRTAIENARSAVREALEDNFNTPAAMLALSSLVKQVNRYIGDKSDTPRATILQSAAEYISYIFEVFGLINPLPELGFSLGSSLAGGEGSGGASREETLAPVLDILAAFRESVRSGARAGDAKALLKLCDELRDSTLPLVGVRLEDSGSDGARWKLEDPEVLKNERAEKEAAAAAKRAAKRQAAIDKARKTYDALHRGRVAPADMFRSATDVYSEWDEAGVPTKTAAGEEIAKSARKKLVKEQKAQEKFVKKYAEWVAANGELPVPGPAAEALILSMAGVSTEGEGVGGGSA
jgi:cysteinyl-tRNA synthetase